MSTINNEPEQLIVGFYELMYHGLLHSSQFYGADIVGKHFRECYTGRGYTIEEALEICLDRIEAQGYNPEPVRQQFEIDGTAADLEQCAKQPTVEQLQDTKCYHHYITIMWS